MSTMKRIESLLRRFLTSNENYKKIIIPSDISRTQKRRDIAHYDFVNGATRYDWCCFYLTFTG